MVHGNKIILDEEKQDIAFNYLSENFWGGNDLDTIREQRNKLFDMFNIKPPKLKGLKKKNKQKTKEEQSNDNNNNNNNDNNNNDNDEQKAE